VKFRIRWELGARPEIRKWAKGTNYTPGLTEWLVRTRLLVSAEEYPDGKLPAIVESLYGNSPPRRAAAIKSPRNWSPAPKSKPTKPPTISMGRGRSFTYSGKRYTNLVDDEKHYSPADLARAWSFDVETIRNIFRNEPGVLKIGEKNPRGRRMYLRCVFPRVSLSAFTKGCQSNER
jgi:hypothetical protein